MKRARLTKPVPVKGGLRPFETVAQVRALVDNLDDEHRAMVTWRHLARTVEDAEATGATEDVRIALQMVLSMNGLLGRG